MFAVLRATENACAALAISASASASLSVGIYTGIDNDTIAAPAIICYAESAREEFPNSGVFHVTTHIFVKEMAADSSVSSSISPTIFQAFMREDTISILNQYPNYYVYDVFVETAQNDTELDAWSQQYIFDVVCATK